MIAAVDVHDLAGDRRARGLRAGTGRRRRPGPASSVSQASGACASQPRRAARSRGSRRPRRLDRARGDEVRADAARAEVAREVAVDGLQRGLRDAHPVVAGQATVASKSRPTIEGARPRQQRQRTARRAPSASRRSSGRRSARCPAGVSGSSPPSASAGAKAIACRTPSSAPQRCSRSSRRRRVLGVVDVELEHVGPGRAGGWRSAR